MARDDLRRIVGSRGLVILVTLLFVCTARPGSAQRAIPDDNLAYPVLIQRKDGFGSGFYMRTTKAVYLVTAKHVLFDGSSGRLRTPEATLLSYPRDPKEAGRNVVTVNLTALAEAGHLKAHATEDVATIRLGLVEPDPAQKQGAWNVSLFGGVAFTEATPSGILAVAPDSVKQFDEILIANDILVFGYPNSIGLKELPQLDPLRPLLRAGIIAGQNPRTKSIVVDCPVYPGNSGGPVLEISREGPSNRFQIIGVVREFVPFEERWLNLPLGYQNRAISNSGYMIATPMDFVLELVE